MFRDTHFQQYQRFKEQLIEKHWNPKEDIVIQIGNLEITIYKNKEITIIENGDTLII